MEVKIPASVTEMATDVFEGCVMDVNIITADGSNGKEGNTTAIAMPEVVTPVTPMW